MRTKVLISGILALGLVACSTARMQSGLAYNDDIYYNPKGKPLTVPDTYIPVIADKSVQSQDKQVYDQKVREYSRTSYGNDPRDFSQIQTNYAAILADKNVRDVDTVVYYNDKTGYWVNGFSGSSYDQDYAERLVKFHGPFRGIPYWSPLYTQVVYFSDPDWNVYVDGNYAYAFPSWSNRMYSGFYFGGYRPYWNWSFGIGMGYGYGWPYYGWYDSWNYPYYGYGYNPYWGWGGYPGYWQGWGWGHHHHHYYPGGNVANRPVRDTYYGSRTGNSNNSVGMNPNSNYNSNTSNSYRSSGRDYYSSSPSNNGTTNMNVSRDGNIVKTEGRVNYSRPSNPSNGTNKGGTIVNRPANGGNGIGSSPANNNSTTVRDRGQRSGSTVTQRYNDGSGKPASTGSSSRPSYTPSNSQRSTVIENSGGGRSSGYTPGNNNSTYTPSRSSSGNSNSGGGSSTPRSNRR